MDDPGILSTLYAYRAQALGAFVLTFLALGVALNQASPDVAVRAAIAATTDPTSTSTATVTPSVTSTTTATPVPTLTVTPTLTPNASVTATAHATETATPPVAITRTPTRTPTRTATATATRTITPTATRTVIPTLTATPKPTLTVTPTATPRIPLRIAASPISDGLTSSSATITWLSTQPGTSQVEFGLSTAYGFATGLDAGPTSQHRQVITGLLPATVYHYRVKSVDALGASVVSADATFTTRPRGVRGSVDDVIVRRITATTATINWSAATSIAQVEYGISPAYGLFTLLQTFSTVNQEVVLTNLVPETLYHYRIKTWNSSGVTSVSPDFTFTTAPPRQTVLLGNAVIDERRTSIPAGEAFVFQYSAASSGLGSVLRLYVDAGTTAQRADVAVYADQAGRPGPLLVQTTIERLIPGAWNQGRLAGLGLSQGSTYWVGVLNPAGTLNLRGGTGTGRSEASLLSRLTTLPLTWASAPASSGTTTLSAFVQQVMPSVALVEPADGRSVSGLVSLSATVDDDAAVTSVQFLVDDAPIGGAGLGRGPYTFIWDSRRNTTHDFHTVSVRVTDALGRISTSAPAYVHVDNGAAITQVAVSQVTATSAWVSWSTDSFSDSQVEFGLSAAYGQSSPQDEALTWQHRQLLTGLLPGTTYHFRVRSRDLRSALGASPDFSFTTRPASP